MRIPHAYFFVQMKKAQWSKSNKWINHSYKIALSYCGVHDAFSRIKFFQKVCDVDKNAALSIMHL